MDMKDNTYWYYYSSPVWGINKLLSGQFDYDNFTKTLSDRELEMMSGLLPKSPIKRIEPTDDWFKPTR